jgi:hypothetical protein
MSQHHRDDERQHLGHNWLRELDTLEGVLIAAARREHQSVQLQPSNENQNPFWKLPSADRYSSA